MCCLLLSRNSKETYDPSDSFSKDSHYSKNMPSNKIQSKEYHWNEIHYEIEVDDDQPWYIYHQMQEQK